jgi:hypothetical protein
MENQQAEQIAAAGRAGASSVGAAFDAYGKAAGAAYPNLSGVASALGKVGGGSSRSSSNTPQYGLVPNTPVSTDPGVAYTDSFQSGAPTPYLYGTPGAPGATDQTAWSDYGGDSYDGWNSDSGFA